MVKSRLKRLLNVVSAISSSSTKRIGNSLYGSASGIQPSFHFFLSLRLGNRQGDHHFRPRPNAALYVNFSIVVLNNFVGDCHSQPGPLSNYLRGEKWIEYFSKANFADSAAGGPD